MAGAMVIVNDGLYDSLSLIPTCIYLDACFKVAINNATTCHLRSIKISQKKLYATNSICQKLTKS